jgi:hypothetical protein
MANVPVHTPTYPAWPVAPNRTRLDIVESLEQRDLPLDVALTAPGPVYIDPVTGNFKPASAAAAGAAAKPYGIAVKPGGVGETVTAVARGELSGFDFSGIGFGADIFLSDAPGQVADAAGTVNVRLGEVMPVTGAPVGSARAKTLRVRVTR